MSYSSTFGGINTALRGLLAHQAAMDTTGHNISNVNTEGYSRQTATLSTTTPYTLPAMNRIIPSQMGTGVEVSGITRARDQYIDRSIRNQFGSSSASNTALGSMQALEVALGEPSENAISGSLRRFLDSMSKVAASPNDPSARQVFAQSASQLASQLNQVDTRIVAVGTESDDRLNQTVPDVNQMTARIASLNDTIKKAVLMGQQPNDALDQRDQLMDNLSKVLNYTYTTNNVTKEVTITFGTTTPINLVDPLVAGGFTAIVRADLDTAYGNGDLTAGQAYGDEDMFNTKIPALRAQLDNLANSLVSGFNAQNTAGFDLTGTPGGNIFNPVGTTAATIQLDPGNNILTNTNLIAAASSWLAPGEPLNGGNALAMAGLRNIIQGAPMNATFENYYGSVVSGLGTQAAQMEQTLGDQANVADAMESRRQSVSGVSMDEELSDMMRFQHAYQACARVLTTLDEGIDTIINRMGRVGL
ncbi:MAG: flagellar hook-associated protein FlgK [Thermoleophilia bacterium]|nr:flagellar hook-associated protein FlgK [Thermoleophilia bacterium]